MSFKYIDKLPPVLPYVGMAEGVSTGVIVANTAYLFPVWLPRWQAFSVWRFARQGAAVGNIDLGIYRSNLQRLISTGSIAYPATPPNVSSVAIPGGQIGLAPGLWYLALCGSGATSFFNLTSAAMAASSILQKAASFPLPSSLAGATEANPNCAGVALA